MPERVIFEAGDPDFDTERPDRNKERIKLGRKLIIIGAATICLALLMVFIFIFLVVGFIPSAPQKAANCSAEQHSQQIKITTDSFGTTQDGIAVDRYTMTNTRGMVVQVISFGARVTTIKVPDKDNSFADVVLGFDTLTGYESTYFGGVIGRVVNRIAGSSFVLDGRTYSLSANDGVHHLHGGIKGWDKHIWKATVAADRLTMSRTSPDGEEGYPGEVVVNVTYLLTDDNWLSITYSAETKQEPTPINLSSGIFFNLVGQGAHDIYNHSIIIYADYALDVNEDHIPTGIISPVNGTTFDLRRTDGTVLGSTIQTAVDVDDSIGFDRTYCLRGPTGRRLAARVRHAASGRTMMVYTNQPSVQFYTANHMNVTGKAGHFYGKHSGFVLETQGYPDAIHHANFPDIIVQPGSTYIHEVSFVFSVD